jgi:hypothetical protein
MGKALYTLENGSCLIHNSKPPRYWYNYLWNDQGYCAQVSQIGHGRSYYINDRADMCRLNNEDAVICIFGMIVPARRVCRRKPHSGVS